MDLKKEFNTDQSLEESGVWVDIGDDAKLKVARAGNKQAVQYWREISRPYSAQIIAGKLSDEKAKELSIKLMAQCILLDWKGMQDDGADLPYSKEAAVKVLTDYPDFRNLVSEIANERKTYQKEIDEAITKK